MPAGADGQQPEVGYRSVRGQCQAQTLDNLVKSYVQSIKTGSWSKAGWPDCAYSVTKMAVNCYTKLLQEKLDKSHPKLGIMVNSLCPGTMHSKMRLSKEETSADITFYSSPYK